MNDIQQTINDLSTLEAEASPAPWASARMINESGTPITADEAGEYVKNTVIKSAEDSGSTDYLFVFIEKPDGTRDVCHAGNGPTSGRNTKLIVAMRNALPSILDELQRLRDENARLLRWDQKGGSQCS